MQVVVDNGSVVFVPKLREPVSQTVSLIVGRTVGKGFSGALVDSSM